MSSRPAGSDDTISVAVIGAGNWGRNLIRAFDTTAGARLVAVCDREPGRLEAVRPGVRRTLHFDHVLRDTEVDAVAIATPPDAHASIALAALEAGKHVFVEKPMALSVDDAERIVAASRRTGRRVMVGHVLRYHPAVVTLKRWIDGGILGEILELSAERCGTAQRPRPEGAWWSLGPHDVSLSSFLIGARPATILAHRGVGVDGVESFSAHLTYSDGVRAHLHVDERRTGKVRRLRVTGTLATALFDDVEPHTKLRLMGRMGTPHPTPNDAVEEPLLAEIRHFVASLRNGTPFFTDAAEGLQVVKVLADGESSARLGRPIAALGHVAPTSITPGSVIALAGAGRPS